MTKTKERIKVTLSGWDGKSYNGEATEHPVYIHERHPGVKFIKARYAGIWSYHKVLERRHDVSGELEVMYWGDC